MKMVTPKFYSNSTCRKLVGNIGVAVEQEEKLCDYVATVDEFTYLGDRLSAGGVCESVVTSRTRCGWAIFRECVSCCMAEDFL